jgi:hypothetical protein
MPCRFPSKKNTSLVDSEVPETKLLAFARDLPNSDKAGHRLALQLFAQSAPFANLAAVHRNFDWDGPCSAMKAGTK